MRCSARDEYARDESNATPTHALHIMMRFAHSSRRAPRPDGLPGFDVAPQSYVPDAKPLVAARSVRRTSLGRSTDT